MQNRYRTWVIVLAAGDGSRLKSLTMDGSGAAVPKQFCSLCGGSTLFEDALARAAAVADPTRVCAIVAAQHRRWWSSLCAELATSNIVVQPINRGTAIGILLPLLHIVVRDGEARIVLLPSDHYVGEENILARSLRRAVEELDTLLEEIVLLGIDPDYADPEFGYIVTSEHCGTASTPVERFVEKPDMATARKLIDEGALWNSFIIAARASALVGLFVSREPAIVASMRSAIQDDGHATDGGRAIALLYECLPGIDFSSHVLQCTDVGLRCVKVDRCGWNDLGTPTHLAATVRGLPQFDQTPLRLLRSRLGPLNLSLQFAKFGGADSGANNRSAW